MIQKTKLLSMILLMMMVGECMAIPADTKENAFNSGIDARKEPHLFEVKGVRAKSNITI